MTTTSDTMNDTDAKYSEHLERLYADATKDMCALMDSSKHTKALQDSFRYVEEVLEYKPRIRRTETLRHRIKACYNVAYYAEHYTHLTNSLTITWENKAGDVLTAKELPNEILGVFKNKVPATGKAQEAMKALDLAIKSGVFEREITNNFEHLIPSDNVARYENDAHVVAFMEAWFEKLFNRPLEDEDMSYTYEVMNQRGELEEAF